MAQVALCAPKVGDTFLLTDTKQRILKYQNQLYVQVHT